MKRTVGLWVYLLILVSPAFCQVDTSYIYNTAMPYGTLDLRIAKSATRYYYLQEDVTFSFRESAPGVKTNTYADMTSWNSEPYRQGNLREKNGSIDQFIMNYRLLLPKNYNPEYDPGYPIIIMLHGYGERGNCWNNNCYWSTTGWNPNTNSPAAPTSQNHNLLNNDHNLLHGGQKHLDAVNLAGTRLPNDLTMPDKAFPGFVLFPQVMNGWQQTQRVEEAIKLLRLVLKKYNIDENRVYIHALSNGGGGLYQAIKRAPWLFAAALPMSAVTNGGIFTDGLAPEVGKIPMRVFQGGKDTNPTPSRTYNTVKGLREAGASVQYYLYPHLGHGTWNTAYSEPDFFSWILNKKKYNPHVYYGNPVICATTGAGVRISFSNGFRAYQWEQDGVVIDGAITAEFMANTPGTYRGRFSRVSNPTEQDWEPWSDEIVVTEINPAKPGVAALGSTHLRGPGLPSAIPNNTVQLKSNEEAERYLWYKNGTLIDFPGTDVNDTLKTASFTSSGSGANGLYTLKTSFSYCPSPASDPVYVYFNNSAPQNMTFNAGAAEFKGLAMKNGIFLSWNDLVSAESGYELWRRKSGETEFKFAGRTEKNAISFFDGPLQPNSNYEYKIRAVGNTGVSNYVPSNDLAVNLVVSTPGDTQKPMPPQNLRVSLNTINSFTLSWDSPTDNTGIKSYIISYGNQTIETANASNTFTVTGLPANTTYPVTVKAVDHAGNTSEASNQIIGSTYVLGLFYKHSTGGWEDLDDTTLVETWVNPEFTGTVPNVTLTPRTQEDFFNFQFTGYFDALADGPYIFRLTSNDGSRLLIDNILAIENNGLHGNVTKFSDTLTLAKGPHHLELQYFDYAGTQTLTLQYKGPDLDAPYKAVPDSLLRSGKYVPAGVPALPANLVATGAGIGRIELAWESNGSQVELYRSLAATGPFAIIGNAATGALVDTVSLHAGTTYFYKARTISATAMSAFSDVVNAATSVDNTPPSTPTNLILQNKNHTSAALTWTESTDNTDVKLYEIFVNGVLQGTSEFPAFMVTGLDPGSNYTITVKAVDGSNNKSETSAGIAVTTNPAATYYSLATGNLNTLSTWKQNVNGTGNSPIDFTENGLVFIISNRTSTGLGGDWDVSGAASKVIVPTGVTLNADYSFAGNLELEGNAMLNINSASVPVISKISPASTINFNGPVSIPVHSYGNVIVSGTGVKALDAGITTLAGNLTVGPDVVLKGAAANQSQVLISGNFIQQSTSPFIASDNRIDFHFTGEVAHTITANTNLYFYKLYAGANSVLTVSTPIRMVTGSLNGGGVVLASGSTLNVNGGALEVIGAGTINPADETGVLQIASGNLKITSTAVEDSNVYFSAISNSVDSLTVNVTEKVVVRTPVFIEGALIIKRGEVNGGGFVTLKSTANNTASLSEIGTEGMYSGNLHVQHYIPYVTDQRIELASAVSGVSVANWQTYFPITGNFAGASMGSGEASLFTFDGTALAPYPPTGGSNSAAIEKGKGYQAKISNASAFTLETNGNPYQGPVAIPLIGNPSGSAEAGWNLIANPYASSILWSDTAAAYVKSGVANTIAVKENKMVDGVPIGQYQYYSADLGKGSVRSGSAFWVRTTNATPSLTIQEKAKDVSPLPYLSDSEISYLKITLKQNSKEDHSYIFFSVNATDGFDPQFDFPKKQNDGLFNLSTLVNGTSLAVNAMSNNFCSTAASLSMTAVSVGNYSLQFDGLASLNGIGQITLKDTYLNTTVPLGAVHAFSITADGASAAPGRFVITFTRTQVDLATPQATGNPVCDEGPAKITLTNSQAGVHYTPVNGDQTVMGESVVGTGETIFLDVVMDQLVNGVNTISVQAGFPGCLAALLQSRATVNYTQNFEIDVQDDVSVCVGEQAQLTATGVPAGGSYKWFDEAGEVIAGQTGSTLTTESIEGEVSFLVSGVLSNGCESAQQTVHVYADTLEAPEVVMHRDTLFTQVDATFQWYRNGNVVEGATQAYFVPDVTGEYTVVATSSGCSKISQPYEYVVDPGCTLDTSLSEVTLDNPECTPENYSISIANSNPDVVYALINANDELVSESLDGNNDVLLISLASSSLDSGVNRIRVRAEMTGCINRTLDDELTINNIAPLVLNVPDTVSVCAGTVATLDVKGGVGVAAYQWFDSSETLIKGQSAASLTTDPILAVTKYFVSVQNVSGCWSPKEMILVIPVVIEMPEITAAGGVLSVKASNSIQWYLENEPIADATTAHYTPLESGNYTVRVSDGVCENRSGKYLYLMTAVGEGDQAFELHAYPNPSTSKDFGIKVQSPDSGLILIQVVDMTGRILFKRWFEPKQLVTNVNLIPELKNGLYSIIASQGEKEVRKRIAIRN